MIRKLLIVILLLVGFLFGSSFTNTAWAADTSSNITIRPFLEQLTLNPNEGSKQFDLTISNNSKFNQRFTISAVNFGSLDETGGVLFEGANSIKLNTYGLAGWIVLDKDSIELGPGEQSSVKVSITNGNDLAPGAHYAAIIVSGSANKSAKAQLSLKPQVSSLVFVTKLGGERYNIHLSKQTNNSSIWKIPSKVNLKIASTGNTFIIPRGIVSLRQNDKIISKGIINDQSSIVLPQSTRDYDVSLQNISKVNTGILFSKYQVRVDYRYDGIDRYATKTYNKIIINKLTVLLIVIILLSLLVYKRLIHDNQKLRNRAKHHPKAK